MSFPDVKFTIEGYSISHEPAELYTEFSSRRTRNRKLFTKNNYIIKCRHVFTDAQTLEMENYINGFLSGGSKPDMMPYYPGIPGECLGFILDGEYEMIAIHKNLWEFKYTIELVDRDMSAEKGIYDLVNEYSGFDGFLSFANALEDAVNNNSL